MSDIPSFKDEVKAAIRRHEDDLDADDLRDLASGLNKVADKWEALDTL